MVELHRELRAARRHRAQRVDVAEHVGQRHEGVDRNGVAARFLPRHLAPTRSQVADDVAGVFFRRDHFDLHHRFQQLCAGLFEAFAHAHELGMATILWCYTRNEAFKTESKDYHAAADLTGQANHLGVTIQADIIKQKLPTTNFGFREIGFGKYNDDMYRTLTSDHPIDLCRFQVANCYMGQIGLINSGGGSKGGSDLAEAVRTAVINKRAGGMGLILGRKAFQRPMKEGVEIIHHVQQVYLEKQITVA